MTTKRADRTRYDPNEDWMPKVPALAASRQAYFDTHPMEAPAKCPLAVCGYRGTGIGRSCPNVGNTVRGAFGEGAHGPTILVLDATVRP